MVVKKKKKLAKVEAVAMEADRLRKLMASLSVDGGGEGVRHVAQTLRTFLGLTDPVQQVQLIKQVGSQLHALNGEDADAALLDVCLHTLALVYTSLQAKNPLRRAVASAVGSVPKWLQQHTVDSLSSCLSRSMSSISPEQHAQVVDTIAACLDGFPLGERCINRLLPEVLQFLHTVLSNSLHQNRSLAGRHIAQAQLMQACLSAVKTSMLVIQRCEGSLGSAVQDNSSMEETLGNLMGCYTHILTDEEFIQSVQSTGGMAVVLLIRSVMGCGDDVASIVCSLLQPSAQGLQSAPRWLGCRCEGLCASGRPPSVSLYLCHGALAMLSWKGSLQGPKWEELLLLVPNTLLGLDVSVKESTTAMVVARVLTLWSGAALDCLQGESCSDSLQSSLGGGSELQRHLLEHIESHWEHPLDGVRHQTRSLFRNLLLLHQHCSPFRSDPTNDPYITELTHSLLGLEWHMRGKYGSLGCLVELYGAAQLLRMQPKLPLQLLGLMGDQTLAPYASDLLERLFVSHKAQLAEPTGNESQSDDWMLCWHQTWVTPLLHVLCRARPDQTTYILDYFLPKLLRCSPSSLAHMVKALQDTPPCSTGPPGSRGALGALMTCLRAARAQGVVPTSEGLWGGLVPLSLLQQALVHKHHQVRMDALGLVCESHRSTEVLSSQEMDLIRHFLPPNLNSQSPGVRQQTVSLMKKLLCRVRDSTQLLTKRLGQEREQHPTEHDQRTLQHYKVFLRWLCETLLDTLVPGAPFSKCLTSLHLLCLLGQLFTFSTGSDVFALGEIVTGLHAQNVLYCVGSNFLEVKQLASALQRQLPPSAVDLQKLERMQSILQAALQLSTSTKPFDSVTAAHLLQLLLPQPHLIQALLHCAQDQSIHLQPLCPPAQAPETLVVEINTLAVVQFLLRCLQSEVQRAETSLLQAAASSPLYGRAHCITAVLQHLSTESLSQTECWRSLVSELIAVCYRISDVVSPIVQSSSPEGLIPMDTDSEASAGLQKILQEIQPRDTNDFFTRARELNTHTGDENTHAQTVQPPPPHDEGEGYRVTAQMVLVCCWRSMKEVAMLLGQLCHTLPLDYANSDADRHIGLITDKQVEGVGLYFRQQLLQSRHRGAFELAYVGFVRLTDTLCRSGSHSLQQLPARWLSEVLKEVKSSGPSSKLCATRRSAGIPFYVQALLSSEPKSCSCRLLKMTMKELMWLATPSAETTSDKPASDEPASNEPASDEPASDEPASDEPASAEPASDEPAPDGSTVPQVHALNILRALYRDTRLGENIIPFVSEGMQAAILGFTSPVWAVRNSSTLLFSTLITRIFGVKKGKDEHSKKNRMTGREFFTRFPTLYPFLLKQLEEAAATVESHSGQAKLHPSLFLLLLVLSRLYPSPMDGSSSPLGLAPFMPFIMRCGRSAVYRTREMAAWALVPFVLLTNVPATVRSLLEQLPAEPGHAVEQNHMHGTLLQVLFLLRSYRADSHRPLPAGSGIGETLGRRMWLASRQNHCLVTRGAVLEVVFCLCGPELSLLEGPEAAALRQRSLSVLMESEVMAPHTCAPSPGPGCTQYLLSLAQVALGAVQRPHLWTCPQLSGRLLDCLVQRPEYEVRLLALEAVLRWLQEEQQEEEQLEEQQEEEQQEEQQQEEQQQEQQEEEQQLEEEQEETRMKAMFECMNGSSLRCRLTSLALHETHPQCQAKALQVLSVLSTGPELQWRDHVKLWPEEEILEHLLTVAQTTHCVELHCAAMTLLSQLIVQQVAPHPQDGVSTLGCLTQWGALVSSCCSEEQPEEVKLMASKVLVSCTASLLCSPSLPLGLNHTVSLWKNLFMLLQDEDQEVRDSASDFLLNVPTHLFPSGVCPVCVCPPAALDSGVALLCRLLSLWGQVGAGVLLLSDWLLGEEEEEEEEEEGEEGEDRATDVDEEDFLFERGDLNLWAEPARWVELLHTHLRSLPLSAASLTRSELDRLQQLLSRARVRTSNCREGGDMLAALCCPLEHARAELRLHRARRTLDVLERLRK